MLNELKSALKDMCEIWGEVSKTVKPLANEERYKNALKLLEECEVKNEYETCPKCCDYENVEFGDIDIINDKCYQHCKCHKCETEFDDIYEYIGQETTK